MAMKPTTNGKKVLEKSGKKSRKNPGRSGEEFADWDGSRWDQGADKIIFLP